MACGSGQQSDVSDQHSEVDFCHRLRELLGSGNCLNRELKTRVASVSFLRQELLLHARLCQRRGHGTVVFLPAGPG